MTATTQPDDGLDTTDALRRDVSFLGAMLGSVITEQSGRELMLEFQQTRVFGVSLEQFLNQG